MAMPFSFQKLIFLLILVNSALSQSSCPPDYEPYKDERCVKVTDMLLGYEDAVNICDQDDSHLVAVDVEEKQIFIENLLRSKNIVDYVWIGLEWANDSSSYKWTDGSISFYENWAVGSPKNSSDFCVQIQTDSVEFGHWSDVLCTKKNLVMCEKMQLWSHTQLQNTVMNLVKNVVPIGFIYVQLPFERSPLEIWPWMSWQDISVSYAGVFFRTVGGNSAPVGEVQPEDSPRLVSLTTVETDQVANPVDVPATGAYSAALNIYGTPTATVHNLAAMVSAAEVRPVNMAVQIWKRIR